MTTRDLPYQNSPFTHMVLLVSEALKGRARSPKRPTESSAGWLEQLDRWFWTQRQREREAYLAQAQDLADLERRMREIDRHIASRYY